MNIYNRRMRTVGIYVERNNQEALHIRNKGTIAALNDLMKDAALVKHRKTLDEVAKAMTRALESDQKWSAKYQELQEELTANERKIKVAVQMSEEYKKTIDTLQEELKKARDVIGEMKLQNGKDSTHLNPHTFVASEDFRTDAIGTKFKEIEPNTLETKIDMLGDKSKLLDEIEKRKLREFELEEELANKEKSIEEFTSHLNIKSKQLEDTTNENKKLKVDLEESRTLNNKLQSHKAVANKKIQTNMDGKCNKVLNVEIDLKRKLHDIDKSNQISIQKARHFIEKNKVLSRNLQITKNQNNLMKLELVQQIKMLNLLSSQCCKLEERDKKQTATINELKDIRDKYTKVIGTLEQKILDLKKKYKY